MSTTAYSRVAALRTPREPNRYLAGDRSTCLETSFTALQRDSIPYSGTEYSSRARRGQASQVRRVAIDRDRASDQSNTLL